MADEAALTELADAYCAARSGTRVFSLVLHALEGLRTWLSDTLPRPVTVLLVSDEEVGSNSSRRITESLARKSAAVLVLEPAYGIKGALKTARKGVGEYTLTVTGKAAHSGLDFEKGGERDCRDGKTDHRHRQTGGPEAWPHSECRPNLRGHADKRNSGNRHR